MKENIIKYWGKKIFFSLAIANAVLMIIFIILGAIFIPTTEAKLIHILLTVLVNFIYLGILYGFSVSNSIYETVYQIKTDSRGYEPKLYRYLLILFGFLWLTFFLLVAFYMFAEALAYHIKLDYFGTLKHVWWQALIISSYHLLLVAVHRQLMWYAINKQKLPWEKDHK